MFNHNYSLSNHVVKQKTDGARAKEATSRVFETSESFHKFRPSNWVKRQIIQHQNTEDQ